MNHKSKHIIVVLLMAAMLSVPGAVWAKYSFIPLGDTNQIAQVDTKTLKVVKLLGPVNNSHGLAITPDGRSLFAASILEEVASKDTEKARPAGVSEEDHQKHHGGGGKAAQPTAKSFSFITRIDTGTGKIQARIDVRNFTHHVSATPDGSRIIGVQPSAGRIVIIDTSNNRVVRYVPVGATPNYALITRKSNRVFVSNSGANTVTVLDGRTWKTLATIPVGKAPEHMAFSEDEQLLYVVNVGSGELSIIDVEKGSVIRTVPTGTEPHGVAFNRSAKVVIVSNKGDDTLSVYDREGTLQQELPLSPQPYHVESTKGDDVWISSRKQGKVWLLSTKDFTLEKTLEIPGIGHQIVFKP